MKHSKIEIRGLELVVAEMKSGLQELVEKKLDIERYIKSDEESVNSYRRHIKKLETQLKERYDNLEITKGYIKDTEKSLAEARKLLKEAK